MSLHIPNLTVDRLIVKGKDTSAGVQTTDVRATTALIESCYIGNSLSVAGNTTTTGLNSQKANIYSITNTVLTGVTGTFTGALNAQSATYVSTVTCRGIRNDEVNTYNMPLYLVKQSSLFASVRVVNNGKQVTIHIPQLEFNVIAGQTPNLNFGDLGIKLPEAVSGSLIIRVTGGAYATRTGYYEMSTDRMFFNILGSADNDAVSVKPMCVTIIQTTAPVGAA